MYITPYQTHARTASRTTEAPRSTKIEATEYMSDSGYPLPPPTFEFLVFSLKTQADIRLGLLPFGAEGDEDPRDLPAARHVIDLLAMLSEKTRGNLSMEEQ